jgi:hypothetical protein
VVMYYKQRYNNTATYITENGVAPSVFVIFWSLHNQYLSFEQDTAYLEMSQVQKQSEHCISIWKQEKILSFQNYIQCYKNQF